MPPKIMRPYVPKRHPLQRLASPALGFSSLLHFAGLSSFGASYKYLIDYPTPINEAYGWHFQYLTILGLALSTLTFTLASLADLTSSRLLFRLKNRVSLLATPLEVLISTLYGALVSIDKELVIPPEFQLGLLPDISFHAVPAVVLTVDYLLFSPPWGIRFREALGVSTVFAFGYWFWVELCYRHNGWYPYPIFEVLSTPWRVVLFCFSGLLMAGSTEMLKLVYAKLNGVNHVKKA
ncbi:hypothetical protein XANCAGTX0491_005590 [Xanthoria calcicola]